jgi:hypothetical protein
VVVVDVGYLPVIAVLGVVQETVNAYPPAIAVLGVVQEIVSAYLPAIEDVAGWEIEAGVVGQQRDLGESWV